MFEAIVKAVLVLICISSFGCLLHYLYICTARPAEYFRRQFRYAPTIKLKLYMGAVLIAAVIFSYGGAMKILHFFPSNLGFAYDDGWESWKAYISSIVAFSSVWILMKFDEYALTQLQNERLEIETRELAGLVSSDLARLKVLIEKYESKSKSQDVAPHLRDVYQELSKVALAQIERQKAN